MLANYHTHTVRCGHAADASDREYVEAAIKAGFDILGFADHVPVPAYDPEFPDFRMPLSQAEEYFTTLNKLKEEYKNDIEIRIGFECEYLPMVFDKHMKMLDDLGCEYIILGQHFIFKTEGYPYPGYGGSEDPEDLKQYVDLVTEATATGRFSYIAHPDVYKFLGDEDFRREQYTRICKTAKEYNIPLEFNLQGFVEKRHHPTEWFLEIAKEIGNEYIIGYDAHRPDVFLDKSLYDSCVAELDKFGLKRLDRIDLKPLV